MPEEEAARQRDKVAEEASHQRAVVSDEASRQRAEVRETARAAAREVVDEAVLTATKLDETAGGLVDTVTDLIKKVGVRKRHAIILYVLVGVAIFSGGVTAWNVNRVGAIRCEINNEANERQVRLWEETFLDIETPASPEALERLERFKVRIHETFPQEECD